MWSSLENYKQHGKLQKQSNRYRTSPLYASCGHFWTVLTFINCLFQNFAGSVYLKKILKKGKSPEIQTWQQGLQGVKCIERKADFSTCLLVLLVVLCWNKTWYHTRKVFCSSMDSGITASLPQRISLYYQNRLSGVAEDTELEEVNGKNGLMGTAIYRARLRDCPSLRTLSSSGRRNDSST